MTVVYHDNDADMSLLAGKTVNVVGYGNMGRPIALNLRDSGQRIIVSEPTPEKEQQAAAEGFQVMTASEAAQQSDIIFLLQRDEDMPRVYLQEVSPQLRRGQMLVFSSAYNVAYGFIEAPPFVDVGLISAKTLGPAVRERFISGEGFASFVAVAQDASRQAWPQLLALARAMGALRGGAVEIGFEHETELDLFVQQAILPIFHAAVLMASKLLLQQGYAPEAVFTELYLSGETSDYLKHAAQEGMMEALNASSKVAQFGMLSRYERFADFKMERLMESALQEIRNGKFAQEWSKEAATDYIRLKQLMTQHKKLDVWELEQQTREMLRPDDFGDDI